MNQWNEVNQVIPGGGATVDLIVENIRCFSGRHVAPLAPLTVLIGENSAGKSTLIAMARIAWDAMTKWDQVDFNEEPFRLGAFSDIISANADNKGESFAVGFRLPLRTSDRRKIDRHQAEGVEVRVVFRGRDLQPEVMEWTITSGAYSLKHEVRARGDQPRLTVNGPRTQVSFPANDLPMGSSVYTVARHWRFFSLRLTSERSRAFGTEQAKFADKGDLDTIEMILSVVNGFLSGPRPFASAPIRTRPARTYDPLTDKPSPEGSHLPMMLTKLMAKKATPSYISMRKELVKFGLAAGLFSEIDVKRMGGDDGSLPFQIRVGLDGGPAFNLVDVGYGVSQVLPILVDAMSNRSAMVLLQQPEVHLHPKAQAQLGSFLAGLAAEHKDAPIVVETHSDYLVDRIRMDIRDGSSVSPADVNILYCGRDSKGVSVTRIAIDKGGNLVGAPDGYRKFFLEEERRFLLG